MTSQTSDNHQYLSAATALYEECFRKPWMSEAVWQDMLRLREFENQLSVETLARMFAEGVAAGCPIEQQLTLYREALSKENWL